MKKQILTIAFALLAIAGFAQQNCYWVFFTDKNETHFDPYSYFDAKAIERYARSGADLYDISNFPLNESYVGTVGDLADEVVGCSRWLNAMGVMATDDHIARISQLPFVSKVQQIESEGTVTNKEVTYNVPEQTEADILTDQLKRFGGQHFIDHGIDGKGLRICVLDAGFPKVNTHPVFKHLRDNHQIIATYNFPKRCENVYGWGTHGTMVLSCIAGINGDQKLGLATGAEFLLGRTEIDPEPFKEEVWWAEGAEWADKNGADIINSSLGYGKERHWTKDMDGTSYVAKAANKAVEKGILICNSAGNEGDDRRWMTIITPADADNVLCIGGIIDELDDYRHISFSSYGPSADKRLKPNVCAFGHALVANPSNDTITDAYGTSFSSPLTTGFCACAWQTRRELSALQMKAEIEKSADLYPYFDYAFGYGVPQAAYFTNEQEEKPRSFNIEETADSIRIVVTQHSETEYAFINIEGADGVLIGYYQMFPKDDRIAFAKNDLGNGKRLNVSYSGFYDSLEINGMGEMPTIDEDRYVAMGHQNGTFPEIKQEAWSSEGFFQYDWNLTNSTWNNYSRNLSFGRRWAYGKSYKIGFGYHFSHFRQGRKTVIQPAEPDPLIPSEGISRTTELRSFQIGAEVFQRVVIRRVGLNWDLGAWGNVACTRRVKVFEPCVMTNSEGELYFDGSLKSLYTGCKNMNRFQYGVTTRLSYSFSIGLTLGVYANYRLSDIITPAAGQPTFNPIIGTLDQPSPWSIGIEIWL